MTDYGLAPVNQPEESDVKVDVIFVHGLGGHRTNTWTADPTRCPETSPFWLQWLPKDVNGARVWTYGYNSSAFANVSADNVAIHAETFLKALVDNGIGKRKEALGADSGLLGIVFVGHSLGGIMIKLIMVKASETGQQYSYIFDNTQAVIFLGSPHRGSIWASRLYYLQRWMPSRQDNNFINLLASRSSSLLADITAQFNSHWGSRHVYTIRETKRLKGISMIVKLEDAKTHCKAEEVTDVDRDHRAVAKPLSRDDVLYKYVIERISSSRNTLYSAKGGIDKTVLLPAGIPAQCFGNISKWLRAYFSPTRPERLFSWEQLAEVGDDIDPVTCADSLEDDIYTTTYNYHTGASIVIKLKGPILEWTIYTPMSLFYPGKHYGKLILSNDFPWKGPKVTWDSPLASPYISEDGRVSTTGELEQDWAPGKNSMDALLANLAAIAVYGPGFFGHSEAIQGAYLPWHWHCMARQWWGMLVEGDWEGTIFSETLPADWVISVTNFFCRNLNNVEEEEMYELESFTPIIPSQVEQSVIAINACVKALKEAERAKASLELGDYKATFERIQRFGEWRREERKCAQILGQGLRMFQYKKSAT